MNQLPKVLEDIILNYKLDMERAEKMNRIFNDINNIQYSIEEKRIDNDKVTYKSIRIVNGEKTVNVLHYELYEDILHHAITILTDKTNEEWFKNFFERDIKYREDLQHHNDMMRNYRNYLILEGLEENNHTFDIFLYGEDSVMDSDSDWENSSISSDEI